MLQGAIMPMQQCQFNDAPKGEGHFTYAAMLENNRLSPRFQGSNDVRSNAMQGTPRLLQGVISRAQKCHTLHTLKGAIMTTQKCQNPNTPTSFIWCRDIIAAMLIQKRTRGRVIRDQQRCHSMGTLPNQFKGDTDMTQQCLDHNSPRERSVFHRSNATTKTPLPTSLTGAIMTTQQCQGGNAPMGEPSNSRRDASIGALSLPVYRGPSA